MGPITAKQPKLQRIRTGCSNNKDSTRSKTFGRALKEASRIAHMLDDMPERNHIGRRHLIQGSRFALA